MESNLKELEALTGSADKRATLEPPPERGIAEPVEQEFGVIGGAISCAFQWMVPGSRIHLDAFVPKTATSAKIYWGYGENSGSSTLGEEWRDFVATGDVNEWMHFDSPTAIEAFGAPIPGVFYGITIHNDSGDRTRSCRVIVQYDSGAGPRLSGSQAKIKRREVHRYQTLLPTGVNPTARRMFARQQLADNTWGPWLEYFPSGGLVTFYQPYQERPSSSNAARREWWIHEAQFRVPDNVSWMDAHFVVEY